MFSGSRGHGGAGADFVCDFIFVDHRLKTLSTQVVEFSHQGTQPSDHFPVASIVQFRGMQHSELPLILLS